MHHHLFGRVLPALMLAACLCLSLTGCKSRMHVPAESLHPALPPDLVTARSVDLERDSKASGETANAIVSDHRSMAGGLQHRLEQHLTAAGFELTSKPSQAERIITLIVLYRGPGSREEMESGVRAGYGTKIEHMHGQGGVLVADLLLVRRRVPISNTHLSNASAANAVSSSQVRLGLYSSDHGVLRDRGLEEALSKEVASLAAYAADSQLHQSSSLTPLKPGSTFTRKKSVKKRSRKAAKSRSRTAKSKAAKTKNSIRP